MNSPITSRAKRYPFEVTLPSSLAVSGVVLADHIKNQDMQASNAEYAGSVPTDTVNSVIEMVEILLNG